MALFEVLQCRFKISTKPCSQERKYLVLWPEKILKSGGDALGHIADYVFAKSLRPDDPGRFDPAQRSFDVGVVHFGRFAR